MNFIKKLLLIAVACVSPLMGMNYDPVEHMAKKLIALSVLGFIQEHKKGDYPDDITKEDVKNRYKELAKQWHPDRAANKAVAHEKMTALNEAYEFLSGVQYPININRELSINQHMGHNGTSNTQSNIKRDTIDEKEKDRFFEAIEKHDFDTINTMLKKNRDLINIVWKSDINYDGKPIYCSVLSHAVYMASVKIPPTCKKTAQGHRGPTLCELMHIWSEERLYYKMVEMLIHWGADLNAQDERQDYPPLVQAVRCGNIEIARLLLTYGADIFIPLRPEWGKDRRINSVFFLCSKQSEMEKLLLAFEKIQIDELCTGYESIFKHWFKKRVPQSQNPGETVVVRSKM